MIGCSWNAVEAGDAPAASFNFYHNLNTVT